MRFRKDLITDYGLFSGDSDSDRHANWTELLFDLIFVAAISQLALNLNGNYDIISLLELIPIFFVIWYGWLGHTFFLSRFGTDDVFTRFFTMGQMIVVAFLTINAKDALGSTGSGFAVCYAFLRFMLVAEYYLVGRRYEPAKPLTNHYGIGFGIAALIWLISAFIPAPWRFLLWGLAIIIDIITPLTAGNLHIDFPPHPTHLPERFGLFTIILIGEAVLSIVFAVSTIGLSIYTGIIGLMGLIIAFTIWWGYFEESKGAGVRVQESEDDIRKYQLWLYSHFPLLLGIVGTAVGVKHIIYLNFWLHPTLMETWLICISLGTALIALSLIYLSAFDWKTCISKELVKFRTPYYIIIFSVLFTGFIGTNASGYVLLGILTLLCIIKIILSLREPPDGLCTI